MNLTVIGCSTTWTDKPVSCYCLNDNILLDSGEGTLKYYKNCGVNFLNIKHIFITHFHTDHFAGLGAHISQVIAYESENQKFRLNIYGPKGLLNALTIFKENFACPGFDKKIEDCINVVELEDNAKLEVEGLKVKTYLLKHGKLNNMAYTFSNNLVTFGYSGDCTYDENVDKFVSNCNFALLDCSSEKTSKSHMGAEHLIMLKNKYPNKRLVAVHCTDEFLQQAKKYNIETTFSGCKYNF